LYQLCLFLTSPTGYLPETHKTKHKRVKQKKQVVELAGMASFIGIGYRSIKHEKKSPSKKFQTTAYKHKP
jgi:hypothetical protein